MSIIEAIPIATREIRPEYFLLPIAGRDDSIKRERVYCYELYHQLRLALGDTPLFLTGEPDKRGHPAFAGSGINPDFILHAPGVHTHNRAAIEVECSPSLAHLTKDLRNLFAMRERGYVELILLLFATPEVPWELLDRAAQVAGIESGVIGIYLHRAALEPAVLQQRPAE